MKRMLLTFMLTLSCGVFAQNDPIWMQLERGKSFFAEGDYGNAMICFRKCPAAENITATSLPERLPKADVQDLRGQIVSDTDAAFFETTLVEEEFFFRVKSGLSEFDRIRLANLFREYDYQPKVPEAYVMMARVSEIEGETELAERYYRIALEQTEAFGAGSSIYEIYYLLIELYINAGNPEKAAAAFEELNSYNAFLNSEEGKRFVEDIYASFKKNGLDKTMELYRRSGDSFLKSYRLAGDRNAEVGDYEAAVRSYLLNVVAALSVLMEELPNVSFGTEHGSVEEVLTEALKNAYMVRFIESVDLFGTFCELGEALAQTGDWQNAQNFFWLTAQYALQSEEREKASARWNEIAGEKIG